MTNEVVAIARRAGQIARETYLNLDEGILLHSEANVVAAAHRASERYLRKKLLAVYRAEWRQYERGKAPVVDGDAWLVNPLDTSGSEWRRTHTINVALVRNGMLVLNIIYRPATCDVIRTGPTHSQIGV